MFELIGLFIGTAILFVLAGLVGLALGFVASLILPKRTEGRTRWIVAAVAFPVVTAAYLWVCTAMLPQQSLFGDIDEPLPNGSRLTGLGKMPEYSNIDRTGPSIEGLDVNGSLVGARVCQTCDVAFTGGAGPYVLIDTVSKRRAFFSKEGDLSRAFGRPLHLVETQAFKSNEPAARRVENINRVIMFVPPGVLLLLLAAGLVRARGESLRAAGHLY